MKTFETHHITCGWHSERYPDRESAERELERHLRLCAFAEADANPNP